MGADFKGTVDVVYLLFTYLWRGALLNFGKSQAHGGTKLKPMLLALGPSPEVITAFWKINPQSFGNC